MSGDEKQVVASTISCDIQELPDDMGKPSEHAIVGEGMVEDFGT